jgi:hypothetical protein
MVQDRLAKNTKEMGEAPEWLHNRITLHHKHHQAVVSMLIKFR